MQHVWENADYEEFCVSARIVLAREAGRLLTNSLDELLTLESTWHPNGFAVFHVDDNHKLGKLRLHIWPEVGRVTRPDDAPIHTHVWHLCSRILVGTYSETLYSTSDADLEGTREYHTAGIDYLVDRDSFTAPGKAFLKPVLTTHSAGGEFHEVPANVPHETLVGKNSFVATLLLTSHPVSKRATMYGPHEIQASTYDRPALSQDQKSQLLRRLEQELKNLVGIVN